jgi:hypothetical protein
VNLFNRLSKRAVDAATPRSGRYILSDSELKGFGLPVEPSGAKTFLLRYRPKGTQMQNFAEPSAVSSSGRIAAPI